MAFYPNPNIMGGHRIITPHLISNVLHKNFHRYISHGYIFLSVMAHACSGSAAVEGQCGR
jgi:hypothetical protein